MEGYWVWYDYMYGYTYQNNGFVSVELEVEPEEDDDGYQGWYYRHSAESPEEKERQCAHFEEEGIVEELEVEVLPETRGRKLDAGAPVFVPASGRA
jgi:hypothetical protein